MVKMRSDEADKIVIFALPNNRRERAGGERTCSFTNSVTKNLKEILATHSWCYVGTDIALSEHVLTLFYEINILDVSKTCKVAAF